MEKEELEVVYKFDDRNLNVTINNKTDFEIVILEIQLIQIEFNIDYKVLNTNVIAKKNNIITKANSNEDYLFYNVPKLLEDKGKNHNDDVLVRVIANEKSYTNTVIQYGKTRMDALIYALKTSGIFEHNFSS